MIVAYSPAAVAAERDEISPGRADPDLRVKLEHPFPHRLPVGRPTAIFCFGYCYHRHRRVRDLVLEADGVATPPTAARMPRRDLFEWVHTVLGEDPEGRSYRSGFWATVPLAASERPGVVELAATVRLDNGSEHRVSLARIELVERAQRESKQQLDPATIAICMATYAPELDLFAAQVTSLRDQTDPRWICVIADDATPPAHFQRMLEVVGDDPRFVFERAPQRVGPYRNFERALELIPRGIELVAPCDQDDRWYPDKLAALRAGLGGAQLVYSDQRLIGRDGRVIRETLWHGRRNEYRNLASLLVANTVPGAAMLLRRSVVEQALPFPNAPGAWYHDHWLALVALAMGDIAYLDRPLYDYVQHQGAVSGDLVERETPAGFDGSRGLRSAYFGGYLSREVQAHALLVRCGTVLTPGKRRALTWFISSARSPWAFLWLAARPLRRLIGRDETLGGEWALVRGIVWRWLLVLAVARAEGPGKRPYDASFPDPPRFEQRRLRRWRAGLSTAVRSAPDDNV
jgi:Glycosyl transferase family 2